MVPPLVAVTRSHCAHEGPALWWGSFFLTVLSGVYITSNQLFPMFGGALVVVLECLNCPIVKDVLSSTAYSVTYGALRHCGTTLVPAAERLLVE